MVSFPNERVSVYVNFGATSVFRPSSLPHPLSTPVMMVTFMLGTCFGASMLNLRGTLLALAWTLHLHSPLDFLVLFSPAQCSPSSP